ncbi:MAG: SurA N-terminal domain-containing protein [Thiolinea sp.]
MLQAIHDKAKGWVAYAIVGFISIPFVLFGINSYFEGGSSRPAAIVNGEEVDSRDVQNQILQLRQQFGRMAANLGDDQLKQMALDNVINRTLLRQKAEAEGYRASANEVANTISQYFQKDGKFDSEQYQRFLTTQRRNQGEFENQVRDDLTQGHFQQAVSSTAFVPKTQAEYYQSLRQQKREIETFTLKAADFEKQIEIKDEQITDYYEKNKSRYMTEEKVKLAYIDIDQDALAEGIEASDEQLEAFYEENADNYVTPESRNVSHVLIEIKDGKEDEAKARAETLYKAIDSGERTFEDVAKNDSDDKVASEKEGELADVVAGDWGPEFEKAVFALEAGKVSEPVKTEAGFEILRVNNITESTQKTFAEAKDDVDENYRAIEAEKLYLDKTDQAQTVAFEQSGDLAPAAEAAGVKVQQTDWVTRVKGEGVAENPKVLEAAFSEEVLNERKNSEPIELKDTQAVVVRVTEHEPAKQKALDEVKDEIVKTLTTQEARTMAAKKGEEVLAKLTETNDWSVLTEAGLGEASAVEKPGKIERVGSEVAQAIVSKAFGMTRPEAGKISWDSAVLPQGDYVFIAIKSVEDGAKEIDEAAGQLFNGSVSNRESGALLKALRERAEIELKPENL